MKRSIAAGLFVSCLAIGTASAPQAQTPNASAPLPAISFETSEQDIKRFSRYFISHKPGVSPEKARADIDECLRYAMGANEMGIQMFPPIPDFVPLEEANSYQDGVPKAHSGQYGLVGDVMAALIVPGVNRAIAQSNVRRCMGYKNYDRYGISKEAWKALNEVDHSQRVNWLTGIASGSAPEAVKVSK